MKTVIMAGGYGSRISEETDVRPKPMVEIGGRPMLWHILMMFSHHGYQDYIIALGYKGEVIKRYFVDYCSLNCNLRLEMQTGQVTMERGARQNWNIELVDTGLKTQTGGRLKRLARYLGNETFLMAWGDGLCDVDLRKVLEFHRGHGHLATVVAVRPRARFGCLDLDGSRVTAFSEKPQMREGWINGGLFALEPGVIDYVEGDSTHWEREPLEGLARDGELFAYQHNSFWQCMDTLREKKVLQELWDSGEAPWKVWEANNARTSNRTQGVHWRGSDALTARQGD